jgi:carboxypeptidase family protein
MTWTREQNMLFTLRRLLQLFACAALMFSRAVHAQGSIAGRVLAEATRAPVSGAEIILLGTNRTVSTDSAGRYSFRGVPGGVQLLITRAVGFAPDSFRAELFDDESVSRDVILKASVTTLGEVRVSESAPVAAKLMAFDERRRANAGGTFFDSTVIAKWEYRKAGDLLSTVSGVDVQRQRSAAYLTGSRATQSLRTGLGARPVPCFMDVYLDGAAVALGNTMFDINSIGLNHVAAIEVYSSAARIPPQYNRTSGGCGVVLLWTR